MQNVCVFCKSDIIHSCIINTISIKAVLMGFFCQLVLANYRNKKSDEEAPVVDWRSSSVSHWQIISVSKIKSS